MSSRHDLRRQAALWSRQLDSKGGSPELSISYVRWLKQSPSHVQAALELGNLPEELERLDALDAELDVDALQCRLETNARAASAASSTQMGGRRPAMVEPLHHPQPTQPCIPRVGRLVKLTAVAVGIMTLSVIGQGTLPTHPFEVITPAGESRSVILRDNTHVRLGPNTRLITRFDRQQRLVELSGGDAMFHVTHDITRPFVVRTDMLTVRVLGTIFAVSRYGDDIAAVTSVTVSSGKVEIQQATAAPVHLEGNDQAVLQAGQALQVSRVNVRDELAWVDNRLVFYKGVTLGSAVQQFNRRNQLQIMISDQALAARPIMGTFRASDPQAFLQHFAPLVPFSIQPEGPDQVRLVPP